MPTAFQFEAATHTYTVDGVRVPSVTQTLEAAGISDYSAVPADRLRYAQELGSAVHRATELYDRDELDYDSIAGTIVEPYLEGWVEFRRWTGFTPTFVERAGVAELAGARFGFTIDRVGTIKRQLYVLDIKTGAPSRSWGPQLAAYEHALFAHGGGHSLRAVVRLQPRPSLVPMTDKSDLDVFRAALALETWKQNHP